MRKWKILFVIMAMFVVVGYALVFGLISLAGRHARELVGLVLGGYERFTMTYTESMLAHLSRMPEVRRVDKDSCKVMRQDLVDSKGFLAVLAVGDSEGNPVCTADESVGAPLPTMSDRPYYHLVKTSNGMVVGDYAISKTTNKQVLHFAYPIRVDEQFKGFVLASVNLEWFANEKVDEYLGERRVEVLGIDGKGKLLYSYPHGVARTGESVVTAEMISAMVTGLPKYQIMRGHDGVYRVYGYKVITGKNQETMLFLAGVSLEGFKPVMIGLLGFMILGAMISWYVFGRMWPDLGPKTRKR